jgi:hypothetical protein
MIFYDCIFYVAMAMPPMFIALALIVWNGGKDED